MADRSALCPSRCRALARSLGLDGRGLRSRRGPGQPRPAILDATRPWNLHLKARDVMGYTMLVFLVLTPLVLLLTYALGLTLRG